MAQKGTLINDMTRGSLLRQLIVFSLPIILGNALQSVYSMVDMIIVGNYLGAAGLSAVGIGGNLQHLLLGIGMGLGLGGQIIISQQVGAKDIKGINATVGTFFSVTTIISLIVGICGILLRAPLMNALNTPPEAYADAKAYYQICCYGMIFVFGYNSVCSVLRGMGESVLPTVIIAVATLLNIGLDLLLVAVVKMGVAGAALATVLSQGLAFLASLLYLYSRRSSFGFDFKRSSFAIERKRLKVILKLSVPMIIWGILMSLSMMFINANINRFGVAASAVDGVGNKLNMIANAVTMGVYMGGGTIVGQCFGARDFVRIKRLFYLIAAISAAIWVISSLLVLLFPTEIFRLFTKDPAVLALAPTYMKIAVITFLAISSSMAPFALIDGIGFTSLELVVGVLDNIIARIGLSILLSATMGMTGYWLGAALSGFVTTVIGTAYFYTGLWKKRSTVI